MITITTTFKKIWATFLILLVAVFACPMWVCARSAIWGIPGASGDPERIARARFAAMIWAVLFSAIEIVLVIMLFSGIRRMRQESSSLPATGINSRPAE